MTVAAIKPTALRSMAITLKALHVNGGLSNGYLVRNNLDPTVGLRFRF